MTSKTSNNSPRSERDALVDHLESLADARDRAALATLRGGLRADRRWSALRLVLPFVRGDRFREDDALLLGGLFALHPVSGSHSLAAALYRVGQERKSESIETRFTALLSADRADLDDHLRHAVTLVATSKSSIGLDWRRLHRDIRQWRWDHVRRAWARDYWGHRDAALEPTDTLAATATTTATEPSEN